MTSCVGNLLYQRLPRWSLLCFDKTEDAMYMIEDYSRDLAFGVVKYGNGYGDLYGDGSGDGLGVYDAHSTRDDFSRCGRRYWILRGSLVFENSFGFLL